MQNTTYIKVWDPLVRVFHWALVAGFTVAYLSGEELLTLHTWAGYTILSLLLIRIVWGLIGSKHARFSNFVYHPRVVKGFLRDLLRLRTRRYLGHNPAGGAMVIVLIISLLLTGFTGLLVYGAEEHAGPLASWFGLGSGLWGEISEEAHEFFANFTLLLVFFHVIGVLFESLLHKENLVSAMITGLKPEKTPSIEK